MSLIVLNGHWAGFFPFLMQINCSIRNQQTSIRQLIAIAFYIETLQAPFHSFELAYLYSAFLHSNVEQFEQVYFLLYCIVRNRFVFYYFSSF